jgi:TPP-dependent pyruvate/acetoin dehydrogenase alpha subunit
MGTKAYENPLLSNKRLREMYTVMVESRVLGQTMRRGKLRSFAAGTEACWVGSAIGLRDVDGDFASAGAVGPVLDLVMGAVKQKPSPKRLSGDHLTAVDRVWFALGAASRMVASQTVGLVYLGVGELQHSQWKQVLTESQRMDLPIVFVAIPSPADEPGIAELATRLGVPGIPVDASDTVAMYRVAQESIGRARAGGGPALIEGVRFPGAVDAVKLLQRQLIARRVATEAWTHAVESKFRARLARQTLPK